jgi:heme/copper-type cytochrome/quinol oxidase subunit 2
MRHFVVVGILVIVMSVLVYVGLSAAGLMPVEASLQARYIDWMWNLELIAMSFLFALIVVPMFYSLLVFQGRRYHRCRARGGQHNVGNPVVRGSIIPCAGFRVFRSNKSG